MYKCMKNDIEGYVFLSNPYALKFESLSMSQTIDTVLHLKELTLLMTPVVPLSEIHDWSRIRSLTLDQLIEIFLFL